MQIFQIHNISSDQAKKLNQVSERILIKRDKGADIVSLFSSTWKGPRYPDWPSNRSIALSSDKAALVWVNKEDHIDYRTFGVKGNSVEQVLSRAEEFSQTLEKELKSDFSQEFGYLTVKPRDSGLGVNFQLKLRIN